jgi:hypothetical protein
MATRSLLLPTVPVATTVDPMPPQLVVSSSTLDLDEFEEAPNEKAEPCPCCKQHPMSINACIIAIDGACRGNGSSTARAACGAFGNIGSEINNAFVVSEPMPTSQRAELHAAISALTSVWRVYTTKDRSTLHDEIIVKTDSASCINKWRFNRYTTAQKKPVVKRSF